MLKFVELCVELRRGRLAKDGLHIYRSIVQSSNIGGLETVMKHFFDIAEANLKATQAKFQASSSNPKSNGVIEDLEQAPEEILADVWGTSSSEQAASSPKESITPSLRFVWEVCRIILDMCRHNVRLQSLYKATVERAFVFCQEYERKAEFRRLSEILRHHLSIIVKYPSQTNGIFLSNPESHQLQLELRFKQLDIATKMELWHEAFRSIEDIHGLFLLARKSAKPSLVRTYYERLARVFQQSGKYLYLSASLCRLFAINKMHDGDEEIMKSEANSALLALCAAPLLSEADVTNSMEGNEVEAKNNRLASFLGLPKAPTRASVIRELVARDIFSRADSDIRDLFNFMVSNQGHEVLPDMASLSKLLSAIESKAELAQFAFPIYRNIVAMVLAHISTKQNTVSFAEVEVLISMGIKASQGFNLDFFLIEGYRSGDFHLKIDNVKGLIRFEEPCFAPRVVINFTDYKKNKAYQVSELLDSICARIAGKPVHSITTEHTSSLNEIVKTAMAGFAAEHRSNLSRKAIIEKKKEMMEEAQQRREREEARERSLKLQAEREAEKGRMAEEAAKREALKREAEKEEIRKEQAKKREEDEAKARENAARRANLEKMIAVVKRIDYLERAYRLEEVPLLQDDYDRQKRIDKEAYEERVHLIEDKSRTQHETDVKLRESLKAMSDDYNNYLPLVLQRREDAYRARLAEAQVALEAAKTARREKILNQVAAKRAEEELRLREEADCLAKAENERVRLETERAAFAEKQKELDRIAEIQRQKQAEIEARMSQRSPGSTPAATSSSATSGKYVPPSRRGAALTETSATAAESDIKDSAFGSRRSAFGSSEGSSWRRN